MITDGPMTSLERRSVASLATLYSLRMLGLFMVLPLLALYAADLPGAGPAAIGFALGCYGLTQALLQVPLGWLSDRVGRKPVIVAGLCVFLLGSAVAALADSVGGIILGRTLQGAGAIASTVMALVADLTREAQRTKAMALVGISIGVSFALALVLGPALAAVGGLPLVFWCTAGLAAAGMAVVVGWVPAPAPREAVHTETGARPELIRRSLRDSGLARLNFGVFTLHFILMACFMLVPVFLEQAAGIDRGRHGLVYLAALLLSLAGVLPLMRYAERGRRPREAFLLGIGALLGALLLFESVAQALLPIPGALYAGLWLFFVGFNYLEATLPSLVSKSALADGRGTALGMFSTCQFFGAFCGGAAGGWLLQHLGASGLIGACLALAALWGVWALRSPGVTPGRAEAPSGAEV